MTLKEIVAKIAGFESALAAVKTDAEVAPLKAEFVTLKDQVGKLAETTAGFEAQLAAEKTRAEDFAGQLAAVNTHMDSAVTALKLDVPADAPAKTKLDAILGAVNLALTKTGVDITTLPGTPAAGMPSAPKDILAEYAAITNPTEKIAFYRAHREEINTAFRNRK